MSEIPRETREGKLQFYELLGEETEKEMQFLSRFIKQIVLQITHLLSLLRFYYKYIKTI